MSKLLKGLTLRGNIWYARRAVPRDLVGIIGKREFIQTLETDSLSVAVVGKEEVWRLWTKEIESARVTLQNKPVDLQAVEASFAAWRTLVLTHCVDWSGHEVGLVGERAGPKGWRASPGAATPNHIGVTMYRLNAELVGKREFNSISCFQAMFGGVIDLFGIQISAAHPAYGEAQLLFADAWLTALREAEHQRLHVDAVRRVNEIAALDVSVLQPVECAAERSIGDLVRAYREDRKGVIGEEPTSRRYNHIFAALEQVIGAHRPLSSLSREDCRKVRDALRKLPVHASKRFPGMTFAEIIEKMDDAEDEVERLAPTTVNSYIQNLNAMMNWAVREEWISKNPAGGLMGANLPRVKRRGFRPDELQTVFDGLAAERKSESWRWWIPLLAVLTGARCNEIAQLRVSDIRREGDIHYIAFSRFDASGKRVSDKRLKTEASERLVPLHETILNAGFVTWVSKFNDPTGRLFCELGQGPNGNYSHDVSKWFARYLDSVGLTDPCLVLHSFRHGFRDAAEVAEISDRLTRAIGGWASQSESERYGNAGQIPLLKSAIDKISYGSFAIA